MHFCPYLAWFLSNFAMLLASEAFGRYASGPPCALPLFAWAIAVIIFEIGSRSVGQGCGWLPMTALRRIAFHCATAVFNIFVGWPALSIRVQIDPIFRILALLCLTAVFAHIYAHALGSPNSRFRRVLHSAFAGISWIPHVLLWVITLALIAIAILVIGGWL